MVPLIKMSAGVYMKTFSRFSVCFREECLEKIHFKEAEEIEENISGMYICRVPILQYNGYMHNQISFL